MDIDPGRLDDPAAMEAVDRHDMLRQVATSAAQVREGVLRAEEGGLHALAADGRPRALVVTGMGGSGIAGDVLAAVCGPGCPVPVITVRSYRLPGWVGAADLVFAVSCSGSTEETLEAAIEAVRRGCRLLVVAPSGSPLAEVAEQARAASVAVRSAGQPRSTLWALSIPLVVAAGHLGLASTSPEAFEAAATRLEDVAVRCQASAADNPAKDLALRLAGAFPMVWGSSELASVAAYRFSCQLAENAKYPSTWGALPEANHNQIVAFDGPFAGRDIGGEDFFRDRVEEPVGETALRMVMLRDTDEHPQVATRRELSVDLADERGVPVDEIAATGSRPLERLASLVGVLDYVSVYLALIYGIDPSPVSAIQQLKAKIAR